MTKRIILTATALLLLWAAPAAAQYEDPFTAEVSDTTVQPGDTITVSGRCVGEPEVSVAFDGEDLGTIPVVNDTYSGPVTIPSDATLGTHTLSVTCGDEVLNITITVGDESIGPLATTGTNSFDSLLKIAGALVVLGGVTLLIATKRRRYSTS
jgi:hypothetical protein